MNIALIGAPGSGKSDLAEGLADKLGSTCIIDNYVPDLETQMNMAMGHFAGYIGNIWIALGRYAKERNAPCDNRITCGSLIETAIYTALYFTSLMEVASKEQKVELGPRINTTMAFLSCLYMDAFEYDQAFYLPLRQGGEIAATEVDARFVDQQIQNALGNFKLCPVTTLTDPGTRLEVAIKALEEHEVRTS